VQGIKSFRLNPSGARLFGSHQNGVNFQFGCRFIVFHSKNLHLFKVILLKQVGEKIKGVKEKVRSLAAAAYLIARPFRLTFNETEEKQSLLLQQVATIGYEFLTVRMRQIRKARSKTDFTLQILITNQVDFRR
jgi:hypothetical protein